MIKVLFVCVHNSARSQMGEAFLNDLGKDYFIAESAGIEPGSLNPNVVEVMAELGYDISQNDTNSVFDFYKQGREYSYVIKVCDEINGQRCPIFPQTLRSFNWNITDPSAIDGDKEAVLAKTREIRDLIRAKVIAFIDTYKDVALTRR